MPEEEQTMSQLENIYLIGAIAAFGGFAVALAFARLTSANRS